MIKKTIYPKTQRTTGLNKIIITNLVKRKVEGLIINPGNSVTKYVRSKDGRLIEHHS